MNVPEGKNLVGAFHQPRLVWAALDTLGTLPEREWRCGLGEIVKHTIIEGEVALAQLERCAARLSRREDVLDVVAASVHTKARIVESDPHEKGHRALLNLGHTLGHAIETTAGYGVVSHGEAVSLGLLAVVRLAASRCDVDAVFVERLVRLYVQLGLPTRLPAGLDPAALLRAMTFDKKRERGMVKLVYVKAAGIVELRPVGDDVLAELPRLVST